MQVPARIGEPFSQLGHESLVVIEEVFVTSENPVRGLVSALTISTVIILQWLLLLLHLWLWMLVLLLLLLLHDVK